MVIGKDYKHIKRVLFIYLVFIIFIINTIIIIVYLYTVFCNNTYMYAMQLNTIVRINN